MKLKELMEKRADLLSQMEALTKKVETEQRAFSEEEDANFKKIEDQINAIDKTIEALERSRKFAKEPEDNPDSKESQEDIEIRAFANIIRQRGEITYSDNGAVIPKTIAKKIIDQVKDISPLFAMSEHFDVKGTVSIPYNDEDSDSLTVAYATEFTDLTAAGTKLLSVDLKGYLAGVLAKVSKSLLNSSDLDLTNFVIGKMAAAVAAFLDKEILVGTDDKIECLSTASQTVTAASATAVTADELIDLQGKLKSAFQAGAIWVMANDTFTAIKKLKDGDERYIFNNEIKDGFSGTILGKPVYVTDQAPAMAAGNNAVFYINPAQALATKVVEDSVQVLNEVYAAQHAIGIVAWIEADAKIQNQQAVAALTMATA